MSERWEIVDTWRSIWMALAIVHGDDPAAAIAGHKRLCAAHGWEPEPVFREGE